MVETNKIEQKVWGFINAISPYTRDYDYYLKTVSFLAYMTLVHGKKIIIDFKKHGEFNYALEKMFSSYKDNDYRIKNTLIEIIKASQIDHKNIGKQLDSFYHDLLDLEYDAILYVFEFMDYTDKSSKFTYEHASCITNREIAAIAVSVYNGKDITDLTCGRGVFLGEYAKKYNNCSFVGYDVNFMNTLLTRMRLILLGVKKFEIIEGSSLGIDRGPNDIYENVFADFPFSVKFFPNDINDNYSIKFPPTSPTKSDWNFIKTGLSILGHDSKMIAIMSEGCLYNTIDVEIRKFLIDNGFIESIISMPEGTLFNTKIAYSLVIFSRDNKKVKFIDASSKFNIIKRNKTIDADSIIQLINSKSKYSKDIDLKLINAKNCILSASRYVKSKKIDLVNPTKISEFGEVFRGYQISSNQIDALINEKGKGEYELLQLNNVENGEINNKLISISSPSKVIDKFLLKENDIIISSKSTNIKIALVEGIGNRKIFPAGSILVLRVDPKKINPKYLKVFLDSNTGRTLLNTIQTGAFIVSINSSALLDMEVSVPSIKEQKRIVDKYDELVFNYKTAMLSVDKIKNKLNNLYESELGGK